MDALSFVTQVMGFSWVSGIYIYTTVLLGTFGLMPFLEVLSLFTSLVFLGCTAASYVIDFFLNKLTDLDSNLHSVYSLILMSACAAFIGALPESRIERRSFIRGRCSISCLDCND